MPKWLCKASQYRKLGLAYCSKEYTISFSARFLTKLMKIAGKRGRKDCLRLQELQSVCWRAKEWQSQGSCQWKGINVQER